MLENSQLHIRNFDKIIEVRKEVIKEAKSHGKNQYFNLSTIELKDEVCRLKESGLSYIKIGKKLNISKSAVSGIIFRTKVNNRRCKN